VLLALIHLAVGGSMFALRALQGVLLGAGLCLALYPMANRMFTRYAPWAGIIAASLSAVYLPFIRYDVELLATSTSGLLIALTVLALTGKPRPWPALAAGFLLGLAALTRPNALLCLPFIAAWIVRAAWRERTEVSKGVGKALRVSAPALLFIASAMAVVLPATFWNAGLGSGSLTMIQANGGLNLYMGNGPEATGVPIFSQGTDWIRLLHATRIEAGAESPAEEDAWHIDKVKAFIRSSPGQWAGLLLRKTGLLLHGTEVRGGVWAAGWPGDPLGRFPFPRFGWILPLALFGLALAAREKRLLSPASVMLAAYGLTLVATMTGERYRLPAVPLLLPYAAYGALLLGRRLLGREGEPARRRALRVGLPVLALLVLLVNVPLFHVPPPDPAEGRYLLSYVHYRNGDFGRALNEAEAAVKINEGYALGWYHLGLCLERTAGSGGNAAAAERVEAAYRRSIDLAPDHVEAMENLGSVLYRQGRLGEAADWCRRAADARPFRPQPLHALGLLAQHGMDGRRFSAGWDAVAAEGYFRKAADLDPHWPVPRFDLGVVYSRTGRHGEAAEQYRQALALDPDHHQARRYLALALEQTGERSADNR
jgi:Flp pilus assembly protein TadD